MVRNIALGILIAAVTPNSLASSTVVIINNDRPTADAVQPKIEVELNSSCGLKNLTNDLSCISKPKKLDSLWMQEITNLLLPPLVADCRERFGWSSIQDSLALGGNRQNSELFVDDSGKEHTLLPNRAIAARCLKRSHQLDLQKTTTQLASSKEFSNLDLPQPNTASQFPKLSRSSLIVDFPQEYSSLVLKDTKFVNPAPETERIASPFGWRRRPYSHQLQFHQGIDYGAPYGSPVVAIGNGIVTKVVSGCADFGNLFCGNQLGNWIEVDHGNGAIGTYGHLKNSSIAVEPGMKVRKNQNIAQVGSSGWSTGAHLDFRLKVNGKHEDPDKYVTAIDR